MRGDGGTGGGTDRRTFLRSLGVALAAGVLAPGCAAVVATPVRPVDGRIRIRPGDHPGLTGPGGYLRLQPEGAPTPIYLLSDAEGYVALSPICTHLGCTVEIQGARLECPCHGSTYDRRGRVLRGPAERSLRAYRVTTTADGTVVIDLAGEGGS